MTTDVIKVVLADDHAVVRAGVKAVLSSAKDIQVIGEASNGRDAVAMVERLNPDVEQNGLGAVLARYFER